MIRKSNLTKRQAHVLDFVRQYVEGRGISPTLGEIGESLGINRVTVFEHVRALEAKGWIRTRRHLSRSIELVSDDGARGVPVLGSIAAGRPIEAIETRDAFDVEDFFRDGCFMLRVQGESMIEDQIRDGDFVLVESRKTARPGETVVALVDGDEATLKRFYPEGSKIRLQPRNNTMDPIILDAHRVELQGVVVGVLRRYD